MPLGKPVMRARTFDAPMLAQVPDMLSKIDAVMAGTKAEPKNAVTLLSMLPMIAEAANAGDFVFWQPDSFGEVVAIIRVSSSQEMLHGRRLVSGHEAITANVTNRTRNSSQGGRYEKK